MKKAFFAVFAALLLTLPCRAAFTETVLDSEKWELGQGIALERRIIRCADRDSRELWLLTLDMDSATLLLATPGDDYDNDGGDGCGASLLDMASAAADHGRRVRAAVNGDFYKVAADGGAEYASYAALGVLVKEGVWLSDGQRQQGATYFGVTKEGAAVLGSAEAEGDWDEVKDTLLTAIGGELWLIRDGESNLAALRWRTDTAALQARYGEAGQVYDEDGELTDLSVYPRSAIGIRADGSVLLLCSSVGYTGTGLTVVQLTELLLEEGCVEAMNLDGGPSTQLLAAVDGESLTPARSDGVSARIGVGLLAVEGHAGEISPYAEEEGRTGSPLPLVLFCLLALSAALTALWRRRRRQG